MRSPITEHNLHSTFSALRRETMADPELLQLELFAQVDELIRRLQRWSDGDSHWEPLNQSRALVRRLLTRLESMRVRLEAPLVVATFGGTGTGKSSLVNALVGAECTASGRERPTTRRPILISRSEEALQGLDLPLNQFEIVHVDSPALRDVVILDCPDPDTNEAETSGSNLEMLRRMLPHCDVLLYTSTQQKYRSARVIDELDVASAGCRLIFVQTHADQDSDIREDWRKLLADRYEVPDVFFFDSVRALAEQQAGQRPTGDFARLQDLLTTRLAAVQRVQIRRANLLDLTASTLGRCREQLAGYDSALTSLDESLDAHRTKLSGSMSRDLKEQLESSRHLWEQRILTNVTSLWGVSPFSTLLRIYNGLGSLLASASLLRARTGAQMVLIGAMQSSRWLSARRKDHAAESEFEEAAALGLDENLVKEAQLVISGHLHDTKLDSSLVQADSGVLRREASRLESGFLEEARRRIDEAIDVLARRNSGIIARIWYETLFLSFIGFVLYRAGSNFFWETLNNPMIKHLPIDFYVSAMIFFALWSVVLLIGFCRRLRRGLNSEIKKLARDLAGRKLAGGLFPRLEQTLRDVKVEKDRLDQMIALCSQLRTDLAGSPDLGSPKELNAASVGTR